MPRILLLILATVFIGVIGIACTRKLKTNTQKTVGTFIALEAFSCRGTCPVFRFMVDEEGNAQYIGKRHTALIGEYQVALSTQQLAVLQSIFDNNGWRQIETDALSSYQDIQRWEVQYLDKRIALHKRSAGEDLRKIVEELEEMINQLDWK